jgi:uncharacterized protein (TIGR02246 family)
VWSADEAGVRKTADAYSEGWNRHDSQALAALFTEDAYWVDVHGGYFRGRAEIYRLHEAIHTRWQKDSRTVHTATDIRFIRPDVAVAAIHWELTGDARGPDVRRGVMTFVFSQDGSRWLIAAAQNTEEGQPAWAKKGTEILGKTP